uniref:Uncharacterized protein n=1 Tax=Anguilla anguilla TaxID=7936 RepID=A0A0E9Q3R6_ANGAN
MIARIWRLSTFSLTHSKWIRLLAASVFIAMSL